MQLRFSMQIGFKTKLLGFCVYSSFFNHWVYVYNHMVTYVFAYAYGCYIHMCWPACWLHNTHMLRQTRACSDVRTYMHTYKHTYKSSCIHYICTHAYDDTRMNTTINMCGNDKTNSNTRRDTLHRHRKLRAQCSQVTKVRCANQIFATWLAWPSHPKISLAITGASALCRISKFWVTVLTVYGKKI